MDKEFSISFKSLWRICLVSAIVLGAIYFRQIILMFLASLILSSSMENLINWLEHRKIPRILSAVVVYIILIGVLAGFISIVLPPLIQNIANLTNDLPEIIQSQPVSKFFKNYLPFVDANNLIENIVNPGSLLSYIGGVAKNFSGLITSMSNFLLIILIAFYLSIDKGWFKNILNILLPSYYKKYFIQLWENAEKKMVFWLYSQLALSMLLTALSIIVFYIMGIKYPLLSAVIFGLFDFIPFIGPILATIVILMINITGNINHLWILLMVCTVLQYIQNIISPYIRSKFLKIDPIITLFFIAIFGKLGGTLGVFVAVPLSTIIVNFVKDLSSQKVCDERFHKLL